MNTLAIKLRSAIKHFTTGGVPGVLKAAQKNIWERYRFNLLYRNSHKNQSAHYNHATTAASRLATPDDMKKISAHWPVELGIPWGGRSYLHTIFQERLSQGYQCVLWESNDELAGAVWCIPFTETIDNAPEISSGTLFEITNLFVTNNHRNKGIATSLLIHACELMHENGYTGAVSKILHERKASLAVHLKSGFRMIGEITYTTFLGQRKAIFIHK